MSNTNWDKWAVIMSGLALIISIIMPIVGYFVLDPKLQEMRHAPRLKVGKVYVSYFSNDPPEESVLVDRAIGVSISNEGRLPATDVKVVFHSDRPVADLDIKVETDPPCPFKLEKSGNTVVILIDRAIGNGQAESVKLVGLANDLETWVYSSQGAERINAAISCAIHNERPSKIDLPNMSLSNLNPKYTSQVSDCPNP